MNWYNDGKYIQTGLLYNTCNKLYLHDFIFQLREMSDVYLYNIQNNKRYEYLLKKCINNFNIVANSYDTVKSFK